MSIDLQTRDHRWCLDASWISYARRPGSTQLRARARSLRATHYLVIPGRPALVGFFTFKDGSKRKSLTPAAFAAARLLGPDAYAEYEPEPGRIWIVATDQNGNLTPFADTCISASDRDAFEARLDPRLLARKQRFDIDRVDEQFAAFDPEPFPLREVSSRRGLAIAGGALLLTLMGAFGAYAWHVHSVQIAAKELEKTLREEARLKRLADARITVVTPDHWLSACLSTAKEVPLFIKGWAQAEWTCHETTLSVTWIRAGGTLANAPTGKYSDQGDLIVQTLPFQPERTRPQTPVPMDSKRALLALLQRSGVQAQIHSTVPLSQGPASPPPQNIPTATAQFAWPTDPRSTSWDVVSGLQFSEVQHSTGVQFSTGAGRQTGLNSYVITATLGFAGGTP